MCHATEKRTEILPTILLCFRAALKEKLGCTSAAKLFDYQERVIQRPNQTFRKLVLVVLFTSLIVSHHHDDTGGRARGGIHQRPISRRKRVTFQRSCSFSWESIPGWTPCDKSIRNFITNLLRHLFLGKFNSLPISNQLKKEDRDSVLCRLDKVFKSNGIVK
ncbi:hypothetical protein TNCV_3437151 [Trichonephila clavipes]|nr:hypothetical protein TNCV_3437151 [Trichonephila clavipes]